MNYLPIISIKHLPPTTKHRAWTAYALLLLLLQGCASTPPSSLILTSTQPPHWQETVTRVSALDDWAFSGKIGVKIPSRIDSAVINRWQQDKAHFTIDLSSAIFGLGATRIEGTPYQITMTESGEEPITSYQPKTLIQQHIGWPLPISQLRYWVKGIPAPIQSAEDQIQELKFNSDGLLSQLSQNGWQVNYSRYRPITKYDQASENSPTSNINLPGKVVLRQQQVKITVIINEWQTQPKQYD